MMKRTSRNSSNTLWRTLSAWYMNSALLHFVLSAAQSPVLFVLFLGGILTYGAWFAWYMLSRFDLINLIRDVNVDDSFYYFQIARNLAAGKFSTFDGGITQTNGYHPLWLLLITPFYWVFDPQTALFGIKALEIMLIAAGVAFIALSAQLARLSWILLFALLPTLYQIHSLLSGMEAAAALFMLGLFFTAICLFALRPARWTWPLAAVAFALPWVRLEYVAISLAATAALCLIGWSWQEKPPGASLRAAQFAPPRTFVPLLGACAGILVYFVYNQIVFGGIVPVSGATKRMWSQISWNQAGGYSLVQNFQEIRKISAFHNDVLLVALGICVCLLLVWWFARRSGSRQDWLLLAFLISPFSLAAGHLAKFAQTVLSMNSRQGGTPWYFTPAYLMMALVVPISCYIAVHFIRRFIGPRSPRAAHIVSLIIVMAGAVFLFAKADFTEPFQLVDQMSRSTGRNVLSMSYAGTLVMNRVLPEDSIVGVWDAGIAGYFSDFPVVNLDGLANDYDFLREYSEPEMYGGGIYHLRDSYAQTLHQKFGATHYAQVWPIEEEVYNFDNTVYKGAAGTITEMMGGPIIAFQLWAASPAAGGEPDLADWFWERMEPHFDYQSGEVGVVVDGRLAQTFAKQCAPDELIVWSWAGQGNETVVTPGTNTHKNQSGICVNDLLLPRNVAHSLRIEMKTASDYLAGLQENSQPAIRSNFDVYHGENRLIYVKERCGQDDVEAMFFLHLDPAEIDDLPGYRRQYGFDNLDFNLDRYGERIGGICLAVVPLPGYDIIGIRTGQYIRVEGGYDNIWQDDFLLVE